MYAGRLLTMKALLFVAIGVAYMAAPLHAAEEEEVINTFPWIEDFESSEFPPDGMTMYNESGSMEWELSDTQNHTPGGNQSALHNYGPMGEHQEGWLITPAIEIPEEGGLSLSFWSINSFANWYESNSVWISTGSGDPAQGDFQEVWNPESVLGEWVETTIHLHQYAGETIYIAFLYEGMDAHGWFLDDIMIEAVADIYDVTFHVKESSVDEAPVADASVAVDNETYTTDQQGRVTAGLLAGAEYTANITAEGYLPETISVSVSQEDKDVYVYLQDDIREPLNLEVDTDGMDPGQALFSWNNFSEDHSFRYDDGVVDAQLGFHGDHHSVMGAAHHAFAELEQMSWYLTPEGGPHYVVNIWVLGLDESGMPDRNDVLYSVEHVTNIDNQWNTYHFTSPLETPDGFFIGLSFYGFLGIAVDDGVGEPWDFVPNTQLGVSDITDPDSPFTCISEWDYEQNFLLRAFGTKYTDLDFRQEPAIVAAGDAPERKQLDTPLATVHPQTSRSNQKAFLGFNVYLDGEEVATEITETTYLFSDLPSGEYTAGVQSVYTTGSSDIMTIDFEVESDVAVTDAGEETLRVYPIPARNTMFVESGTSIDHIRVLDLSGQEVYSTSKTNASEHAIEVSGFHPGVYFLQVTTKQGVKTITVQVTGV